MAPRDSRNSRISATRMEVSCRQNQRAQPVTPMPTGPLSSTGAVESWAPASPSADSPDAGGPACSTGSCGVPVDALSVVLIPSVPQIPTVKLWVQLCMSVTMLSHKPVTSSRPVRISMPPPIRITHA